MFPARKYIYFVLIGFGISTLCAAFIGCFIALAVTGNG